MKLRALAVLAAALALWGCDNVVDPGNADAVRVRDIAQGLDALPRVANPPVGDVAFEIAPDDPENASYPGYDESAPSAVTVHDSCRTAAATPCLDPASPTVWPGALLDGGTLLDGRYLPVGAKRGRLALALSSGGQSGHLASVDEASPSGVGEAISKAVSSPAEKGRGASPSLGVEPAFSAAQLAEFLGASLGLGEIRSLFDFGASGVRTRRLVQFSLPCFSVDVERPAGPSDFLSPGVAWKDLSAALSTRTAPVYVSSVTYGRAAYFCIESSAEPEAVDTALSEALHIRVGAIDAGADLSADPDGQAILAACAIKGCVIGGDPSRAVLAVSGPEAMIKWTSRGSYEASAPVQPLSFSLRYLSDGSPVDLVLSAAYSERGDPLDLMPSPSPTPGPSPATEVDPDPSPSAGAGEYLLTLHSVSASTEAGYTPDEQYFPIKYQVKDQTDGYIDEYGFLVTEDMQSSGGAPGGIVWDIGRTLVIPALPYKHQGHNVYL